MIRSLKKLAVCILCLSLSVAILSSCSQNSGEKVLLISIDGLRSDAVENTEYGNYLLQNSAYSLNVSTVYPSVTLPCHMSMFYSVTPDEHGVTENSYTPKDSLGMGITEALNASGKSSAMFYNWGKIKNVTTERSVKTKFLDGEVFGWEETNKTLVNAAVNHMSYTPTDFTFLYLGFLDEWGHRYGWLSDEYYYALDKSFEIVDTVLNVANRNGYTVIIISDHGGNGFGHGSDSPEDMTIPLFIIGEDFTPGENLGALSILDVAPTVLELLEVIPPEYWQGKAIE